MLFTVRSKLATLALCLAVVPAVACPPTGTVASLQSAASAFENGDIEKADSILTEALKHSPANSELLTLRGTVRIHAGRLADAVKDLDAADWIRPEHPTTLRVRAWAHFAQFNNNEALADIETAVAHAPRDHESHYLRGLILRHQGKTDDAIAAFDAAIALNATLPCYFSDRGIAKGERSTAAMLEDTTRAVELAQEQDAVDQRLPSDAPLADGSTPRKNPRPALGSPAVMKANWMVFLVHGDVLERDSQNAKALDAYTMAVTLYPEISWLYMRRALLHSRLGDHEACDRDMATAERVDPDGYRLFLRAF